MISCFDPDRSLWSRLCKPVTEPRPQGAVSGCNHAVRDLGDVSALRLYVYGIERLAGGHKQPIPPYSTEAQVRADFRKDDHADPLALGTENMHAVITWADPAGSGPDVAVDVGAD